MDAIEYIKEAKRLCESRGVCESVSGKCPLLDENRHCTADICTADIIEKAEKAVQIVEELAKDNSIKTRQREFLRMFPDAVIEDDGILCVDPCIIEKSIRCTNGKTCDDCRREYWLTLITEVTDNGNVY